MLQQATIIVLWPLYDVAISPVHLQENGSARWTDRSASWRQLRRGCLLPGIFRSLSGILPIVTRWHSFLSVIQKNVLPRETIFSATLEDCLFRLLRTVGS